MAATLTTTTRDARFPELGHAAIEHDYSILDAFPRAVDAAEILGVEETRLSRSISKIAPWFDRSLHKRGRELRLPPDLVLEAAKRFKNRPLSEVAARLVDYAVDNANDHAEAIDNAIERYFEPAERQPMGGPTIDEFLDAVRGEVTDDVHAHLVEVAGKLGGISRHGSQRE